MMDMAKELVERATCERLKRSVCAGKVMIESAWSVCWVGERCITVLVPVVVSVLLPVSFITVVAAGTRELIRVRSTSGALDSFARAVYTLQALGTASIASGHVAGAACFAAVAAQACLFDPASWQRHGPIIRIGVFI